MLKSKLEVKTLDQAKVEVVEIVRSKKKSRKISQLSQCHRLLLSHLITSLLNLTRS